MDRERLIEEVRDILAHTGFYLSDRHWIRGHSFDMAARRDALLILVKVLLNVDAMTEMAAQELRWVSATLKGGSILIGEKSSSGPLEEGVVYSRFGIPIASMATIREFMEEGVPPFIFSAPGGLYVRLNTGALRRARQALGISLGQLAEAAHVSRRTIQMYTDGMSATIEAARRLEEFLNEPLVVPLDPLSPQRAEESSSELSEPVAGFKGQIFGLLRHLGYEVRVAQRSPFDAITRDATVIFLAGIGRSEGELDQKARVVANLSRVVERDPIIFVERRHVRHLVSGIPVIDTPELRKLRGREEMVELLEERRA